jgi:ATP-binding cassette subfamily F protein 3
VRKGFGDTLLMDNLTFSLPAGGIVGVIGPNGAGKTTLLKLAAGETAPDAGTVELGHGVIAGYYAQHHFDPQAAEGVSLARAAGGLDPKKTVLETLWDLVPDRGEGYVRSVAGSFLFSGDDADKRVAVLSGGERARVALARLLLVPANLLILDEPTNHLDLDSSEALIEALKGYEGTLLFVSHNRSFLNQLATVIWEVKEGGVLPHPGNLDDWLYHQRQLAAAAEAQGGATDEGGAEGADASRGTDRDRKRLEAEARNARYRIEKPIREEIARLEEEIALREREEREATAALADPALYQDFGRAKPHIDRQRTAREALEGLYAAWEAAHGRLEPDQPS